MAVLSTSGTFTYSASVITLLTAALRLAQIIGDEETPTGTQLESGMDAFSAMVKGWQASGIHLWTEEESILFPNPGQTDYSVGSAVTADHSAPWYQLNQMTLVNAAATAATALVVTLTNRVPINVGDQIGIQLINGTNYWTTIANVVGSAITLTAGLPSAAAAGAIVFDYAPELVRPLRVMSGRRRNYASGIDIPMNMWARLDYQNQPNKSTSGVITAFFYDPQTQGGATQQAYSLSSATGVLNLWPSPSDNTNGFRFTSQRPIMDLSNLANIPDFPVEWNAALKWNLAMEIGPEYGTPLEQLQIIDKQATKWFGMASSWDRESESILMGVAWQPGYRRG